VHRTLHCAMSGAPAAACKIPLFLCAVRWFTGQLLCAVRCAPDRHCRLSGVPISHFKKKRPPARARPEASFFSQPSRQPLCSWRFPSPPATTPPPAISTGGVCPRWAPATSPELFPSVSSSPLPSSSLFSVSKSLCHSLHHPLVQIQISVKSHASNW
jgi:hypothetical protein